MSIYERRIRALIEELNRRTDYTLEAVLEELKAWREIVQERIDCIEGEIG